MDEVRADVRVETLRERELREQLDSRNADGGHVEYRCISGS